jgi:hypothetical protein
MSDMHPEWSGERRLGPHSVTIEPPDVIYLRVEGDVQVEHMKAFMELLAEFPAQVHILRDGRTSGVTTTAAREYMMKNLPKGKLSVASYISFGTPFHIRTIITLVTKAVRLLRHDALVVGFTNTEAEARAWIDRIRADLRRG